MVDARLCGVVFHGGCDADRPGRFSWVNIRAGGSHGDEKQQHCGGEDVEVMVALYFYPREYHGNPSPINYPYIAIHSSEIAANIIVFNSER